MIFIARFLIRGCALIQGIVSVFVVSPPLVYSLNDPPELRSAMSQISGKRMLADIATLSGTAFNGRQTGTEDDLHSAAWVRDRFLSSGLSLVTVPDRFFGGSDSGLPGSGLMTSVIPAPTIDPDPIVRIGSADRAEVKQLGTDYMPILDSPSVEVLGPIVFVGYGIVDPAQGIDDYAGIGVNNCIVLFLRGMPDYYPRPISHAEKVRLARAKGALAYMTATGPILNSYEARRGVIGTPSAFYSQLPLADALPGVWVSTQLAEHVLDSEKEGGTGRLRELQGQLNKSPAARSFNTNRYGSLQWKTQVHENILANVLAFLPGTGPETIVIGAHRDHFGRTAGLLFPGADDNASGTAVMLETARVLAQTRIRPAHSILFVSFSGEENNLLGSRLYISRPAAPLNSTKAMINIDHAGIGNGRLTVGVAGLDKNLAQEAGQAAGLADKLDLFGFFPGGDHVPFKEAGIPTVTVVSGGTHPHFHQATDTAETINQDILVSTARYILALAWQLANQP